MESSVNQKRCYFVTLEVEDEEDVLRRIGILNAALYRILDTSAIHLKRVVKTDYQAGVMELIVNAPEVDPSIVPGAVTARFEDMGAARR
jgi:hypothetical protein